MIPQVTHKAYWSLEKKDPEQPDMLLSLLWSWHQAIVSQKDYELIIEILSIFCP